MKKRIIATLVSGAALVAPNFVLAQASYGTAGAYGDLGAGASTAPAVGVGGTNYDTTINSGYSAAGAAGNVFIQSTTSATTAGTSMGVGPNGVTFSSSGFSSTTGAALGGPVKVTGVANGTSQYDAVNYGQLQEVEDKVKKVSTGVASVAAMANIPNVDANKRFALGVGTGSFQGNSAVAVGVSLRIHENLVAKASYGNSGGGDGVVGAGISYQWGGAAAPRPRYQ